MTCPACGGAEGAPCTLCDGTGVAGMRRCPRALTSAKATAAVETFALMEAFGGDWPNGRPLDEQPAWNVSAQLLIRSEVALIREAMRKDAAGA